MKTLFERLKDEPKKKLLNLKSVYPSIIGNIIDELKNNYALLNVTFETAMELNNYIVEKNFDISNIYNLFNE